MFNTFKRRYAKLNWRQQETVVCTAVVVVGTLGISLWMSSAAAAEHYISEEAGIWVATSPMLLGLLFFLGRVLFNTIKAWRPILAALLRDDKPKELLTEDPL